MINTLSLPHYTYQQTSMMPCMRSFLCFILAFLLVSSTLADKTPRPHVVADTPSHSSLAIMTHNHGMTLLEDAHMAAPDGDIESLSLENDEWHDRRNSSLGSWREITFVRNNDPRSPRPDISPIPIEPYPQEGRLRRLAMIFPCLSYCMRHQ